MLLILCYDREMGTWLLKSTISCVIVLYEKIFSPKFWTKNEDSTDGRIVKLEEINEKRNEKEV